MKVTDYESTSKAKNLGVIMDNCMTMEHHINMVVKTTSFALRNISRMRQYLSTESIKKVVTSMVLSRLDYCNSLLAGLPDTQLNKLKKIQNRAARLVLRINRMEHVSSINMLISLHWLPIKARIEFKAALFCYNAVHHNSPDYICDLVCPYVPTRQLRSSDLHLLCVPKTNLRSYGDRSFAKYGPTIWNSLPLSVRASSSEAVFKKHLKTFLFQKHLLL